MAKWIIVVDDDTANLKIAGHILSKNNMRVTALKSGRAFLDYIDEKGTPDLVLLDIKMPEMDGFETLNKLRELEEKKGLMKTPVIFLTADEDVDTETRGFEVGVSDFIRKPFNPDVLMRRIDNIMSNSQEMHSLINEATIDKLTGFLNKGATGVELSKLCADSHGALMMIDLDSFKLVNDIYGHEMGDKVLIAFSDCIKAIVPSGSKCGRIGGDEFVAFAAGINTEQQVSDFTTRLNKDFLAKAKELMGDDMNIPLGASVGAIYVPRHGNDYNSLLKLADKSLYNVKKNGKHGYEIYDDDLNDDIQDSKDIDIKALSEILGERSIQNVALQLDKEAFAHVYRYVIRYIIRHHINACKVLFTLMPADGETGAAYAENLDEFGNHIRESLRKSDILMRNRKNQYFVFLTDIREDSIDKVINHIITGWEKKRKNKDEGELLITYETDFVGNNAEPVKTDKEKHVVIVDDDVINLQVAGKILSSAGIRVSAVKSGIALFEFLDKAETLPDLILLDIKMPGMDGYETIKRLRCLETPASRLPVIFLTADESEGAEKEGLSLGAMDFIRKPFVPEVLVLRVNNIIELITLQKQLYFEVEQKTREKKLLFLQVISALAIAIDKKDVYTNGHSNRVARYAKKIAKRVGYTEARQDEIYMIGLLHDVGKIGVRDDVLNKPGELDSEEFEEIKKHTTMGAAILESIEENPKIALGAKCHHERYDGSGYPSGLKGEDIPEEARIIAVADAYDAMSSDRSYRPRLTQEQIKKELIEGKGTQFDPRFADVMLDMIEEDKDYKLRD